MITIYELKIIHHDSDIVIVNKPGGLLSVPGRGPDKLYRTCESDLRTLVAMDVAPEELFDEGHAGRFQAGIQHFAPVIGHLELPCYAVEVRCTTATSDRLLASQRTFGCVSRFSGLLNVRDPIVKFAVFCVLPATVGLLLIPMSAVRPRPSGACS